MEEWTDKEREREKFEDALLVHEWCVAQCAIDADFKRVYELYVGTVPHKALSSPRVIRTADK